MRRGIVIELHDLDAKRRPSYGFLRVEGLTDHVYFRYDAARKLNGDRTAFSEEAELAKPRLEGELFCDVEHGDKGWHATVWAFVPPSHRGGK